MNAKSKADAMVAAYDVNSSPVTSHTGDPSPYTLSHNIWCVSVLTLRSCSHTQRDQPAEKTANGEDQPAAPSSGRKSSTTRLILPVYR